MITFFCHSGNRKSDVSEGLSSWEIKQVNLERISLSQGRRVKNWNWIVLLV